jgi:hypothetical protein
MLLCALGLACSIGGGVFGPVCFAISGVMAMVEMNHCDIMVKMLKVRKIQTTQVVDA